MPVQMLATKYLSQEENIWLTSLTDKITQAQFEKILLESQSISIKANALIYALALANADVLKEGFRKMGTSLKAVLDEIGYIDKNVYYAKLKEKDEETKQIIIKSEEKIAKLAIKAEIAELEKAQLARKAEEKAQLAIKAEEEKVQSELELQKHLENQQSKLMEAAIDMLRIGMPIENIVKWTTLSDDEILRLKASIDFK